MERVSILREKLEKQVGKLLTFLRSEEMREELQKKDLNGLNIVRSIDGVVRETFPDVSRDGGLLEQELKLSLKLGGTAIYSLESSLATAESNFRSALDLLEEIDFETPEAEALERAHVLLKLGEIANWRGDYERALENFRSVEALLQGVPDSDKRQEVELARVLEQCAVCCLAGDEASARETLLRVGRQIASLPDDSELSSEYGVRFLRAVSLVSDPGNELEDLASSIPSPLRDQVSSRPALVAALQLELARELEKVTEFATLRSQQENEVGDAAGAVPSNPWEKPQKTEEELEKLEKRRAAEEAAVADLLTLHQEIREIAMEMPDRRFRVLELHAESVVAQAYDALERTYFALQHYQKCLDRSDALLRLDGEMIAPLESQVRAGKAIANVYGESGEGGRRLAALETAYRAFLEAEDRGVSENLFTANREDLVKELMIATIHQFYGAMPSPSALEENSFYADEVRYFGYEANGQLILRGQLAYRTKYPHRLFVVKEIGQVEKGEGPVYTAIVKLDYWLANPEKENDMDYDEPEGEIAQKISFAFGEGGRLKIVEIGSAPKELAGKK
ncbi:MAG: hypothetical protein P1U85_19370 [Verrucomicrobiales bacterium]|nr:hypothetical protein [Verrucomicrobiales bacterium]